MEQQIAALTTRIEKLEQATKKQEQTNKKIAAMFIQQHKHNQLVIDTLNKPNKNAPET